jgi:hypothetical protein
VFSSYSNHLISFKFCQTLMSRALYIPCEYSCFNSKCLQSLQVPKFQKSTTFKRADRWYRFRRYINDFWNVLDTMSYIITFTAIAFRFYSEIQWARRIYSFSLFMMFMRFLHFILIYRKVGVYVILIKEMVNNIYILYILF